MGKYEGHTPGPWKYEKCCDSPSCYLYHISSGVFERATGFDITDAILIADAPMLAEQNERMLALLKQHLKWFNHQILDSDEENALYFDTKALITEIEEGK
jgi:hypothetical protein